MSDCAVHNMPAYPNGDCTCTPFIKTKDDYLKNVYEGDYIIAEDNNYFEVINGDHFERTFIKVDGLA